MIDISNIYGLSLLSMDLTFQVEQKGLLANKSNTRLRYECV